MGIATKVTDYSVLGVNRDPIAIGVWQRRGDNRTQPEVLELSDSLQEVADLAGFNFELVRVIDVLISATAATSEVRAGRLNPMRRRFAEIDNFSFGQLFFLARDSGGNKFAINGERNENYLSVFTSDTFAAEGDVFNL